jgi:hypothetical protein
MKRSGLLSLLAVIFLLPGISLSHAEDGTNDLSDGDYLMESINEDPVIEEGVSFDETDIDLDMMDLHFEEIDVKVDPGDRNRLQEKGLTISISGDHSFQLPFGVIPGNTGFSPPVKTPRFTNTIGVDLKYRFLELATWWKVDVLITDSGDPGEVLQPEALQNYIVLTPWKFRIGAGYQYFAWGSADLINPTDNINTHDYTHGIIPERDAVLSASIEFFPSSNFSLEAVYLPFMQDDRFPVDFAGELKKELGIDDVSVSLPEFDPSTFVAGGRASFFFSWIDFSFSYLFDYDKYFTPEFVLSEMLLIPFVTATRIYTVESVTLVKKRVHYFGADFKTTVGRFGIWAEIAWTMSEDYSMNLTSLRNHQLNYITGIDFNYGPGRLFYCNIQYFGTFNPLFETDPGSGYEPFTLGTTEIPFQPGEDESYYREYYEKQTVNKLGAVTEGLLQGVSVLLDYPFSIRQVDCKPTLGLAWIVPVIYNYSKIERYGNLYLAPSFSITPFDGLDIELSANLYFAWSKQEGKTVSFDTTDTLGIYYEDSRITLSVRYLWGTRITR